MTDEKNTNPMDNNQDPNLKPKVEGQDIPAPPAMGSENSNSNVEPAISASNGVEMHMPEQAAPVAPLEVTPAPQAPVMPVAPEVPVAPVDNIENPIPRFAPVISANLFFNISLFILVMILKMN